MIYTWIIHYYFFLWMEPIQINKQKLFYELFDCKICSQFVQFYLYVTFSGYKELRSCTCCLIFPHVNSLWNYDADGSLSMRKIHWGRFKFDRNFLHQLLEGKVNFVKNRISLVILVGHFKLMNCKYR